MFLTVQQAKGDIPKTEHTAMPMMRKVLWSNANPIKSCRKGNFNQRKTNGLACPFL